MSCMRALHMCAPWACTLAVISIWVQMHVLEHVFVLVWERWWKCCDSACRQRPPHCARRGVHMRPDTCFAQNELWIEAKLVLFSTQLTTEAKDPRRDRMGLASLRALNNKPSSLRKHEGYESLLTLIDSLITWNWILIDFPIACFALSLMQLN